MMRFNSLAMLALVSYLCVYPAARAILDLRDPALKRPGVPKAAWRLYRNLTPRYAAWAKSRITEGRAEQLSTSDISGTEWPLFGSVFYLWGVADLQTAWDAGDHSAKVEPKFYARDAIIAASELVIDPGHASWVKKHWGNDYLNRENVFYRMLVIAALTTREELLNDHSHIELLRTQVDSLADELDASKTGLLEDYPGECHPGDVMAALMCIKRADAVLDTNHYAILNRSVRAFTGKQTTKYDLPPYSASSGTGLPLSNTRGCGNSYMCLAAPELWPTQAALWFTLYERYFWQQRIGAVGFREFPKGTPHTEWLMDVDAGPVIAGHGVSASAFGLGAARKNGRFDLAYPLAAEMLVTVGELPNGVLAMPRLLSNASDAPMLGEAAILWLLSMQPQPGFPARTGGSIPAYVYVVLIVISLVALGLIFEAISKFLEAGERAEPLVRAPGVQIVLWIIFMLAATAGFAFGHVLAGLASLIVGVMLPLRKKPKRNQGAEPWPGEEPPLDQNPPQEPGTNS